MYKIHNKEFKTKKEIKDYCHQTLTKYSDYDNLDDDISSFIKELMAFHPHRYDIANVVSIQVVHKPNYQELVLNIRKLKKGTKQKYEIRSERTSVKQPINKIPVVNNVPKYGNYNYIMEPKIIKTIELDDVPKTSSKKHGTLYGVPFGGRGYGGVNFWDYIVTFEDDVNTYKMCRNSPVESETRGLKVGDSVTFKQTGYRINKVTKYSES
jgi:hypothetical protein